MPRTAFETKLNVLMGRLLSSQLYAVSESVERGGRLDIVIFHQGLKIVLEGSYSKNDAERDANKRLEAERADVAIALNYIREYPYYVSDVELESLLKNSEFDVKIIVPLEIVGTLYEFLLTKRIVSREITAWQRVNLAGLIRIIREVSQYLVREQDLTEVMAEIETQISEFVTALKSVDTNMNVAKQLYDVFYRLYGLSIGDFREINELIYAKAGLTLLLSSILYQSIRTYYGFDDLNLLINKYGGLQGLTEAFKRILTKDYERIYETALEIVSVLPPQIDRRVRNLADLSTRVASKRLLLRKDFSGKVYHRIVGEWSIRKGFATYYTSIPAAYLLAYLSVFSKTGVFEKPPKEFDKLRVCDFACGSGTLLTASYSALQDRYVEDLLDEFNTEDFHRKSLEDVFWGFDALKYAVQITAINLVLQNPTVPISKMNSYTLPLGLVNNSVKLGSLDFLRGLTPFALEAKRVPVSEEEQVILREITPKSIHLVIMNPPFTRATGRRGRKKGGLFGFIIDPNTRQKVVETYDLLRRNVKDELRKISEKYLKKIITEKSDLLKDIKETLLNIGQAGEGLLFLYLAYKYVTPNGKIAFVLPKTILSGVSWFSARALLLDKFDLEHVILSYDPKRGYNFSESTSLSESLIIARRVEEASKDGKTRFVILLNKPETSLEARGLAMDILRRGVKTYSYVHSNSSDGFCYQIPREYLLKHVDNWGRLACFPDPYLTQLALELFDGYLFGKNVPMRRLGEFARIGIDAHQFHGQFTRVSDDVPGALPSVYGGEEEVRLKILIQPNARIIAKNGKAIKTFQEYSSNLLIPDRIWVDTAHVLALYSTKPVLSNIFYVVRLGKGEAMKALTLWLNTTWGILTVLANRSETRGRWIRLKMTHWRLQPVLDVESLDEGTLLRLSQVFDRYSQSTLRRLPEQFSSENPDPVRKAIDLEFLKALELPIEEEVLTSLYKKVHESLVSWIGEGSS